MTAHLPTHLAVVISASAFLLLAAVRSDALALQCKTLGEEPLALHCPDNDISKGPGACDTARKSFHEAGLRRVVQAADVVSEGTSTNAVFDGDPTRAYARNFVIVTFAVHPVLKGKLPRIANIEMEWLADRGHEHFGKYNWALGSGFLRQLRSSRRVVILHGPQLMVPTKTIDVPRYSYGYLGLCTEDSVFDPRSQRYYYSRPSEGRAAEIVRDEAKRLARAIANQR